MTHLRLPKINRPYWENQLREFKETFPNCKDVQFGKQDTRGGNSIAWVNDKDCVDKQIHFESKDMMLGYVQGYLESIKDAIGGE